MERLDDLFLELRALDWELHGFYQRGKSDPPGRRGTVGDELILEWNVRITRGTYWAYGTGNTPAEAFRAALDDIERASNWSPVKRSPPGQSPMTLEDLGL